MANRIRVLQEAMERWDRAWLELIDQLCEARMALGLTQAQVAAALGVSRSWVCRFERRRLRHVTFEYVARHAAVVGLRLSIKLYPVGGAIRDAGQAKYIGRLLARIGHAWRVKLDAPIPLRGDLRGIDVLLDNGMCRIAVEVITRLRDLQAQIRYASQKQRDIGADRLILVLAGTHANRNVLASALPTLIGAFDLDTRRVMACLEAGKDPGRDAIIVLS